MMRSVWKGSVSCGVLNVPVKMYGATEEKSVKFNQLHTCGARINYNKACSSCGTKVPPEEINKGYEVTKDNYVILTQAELDGLKLKTLTSIEIQEFVSPQVKLAKKYYYLTPDKGGEKAFALLTKGMLLNKVWAIAKVAMRDKEQLVLLKPFRGLLMAQTIFYEDELRPYEGLLPKEVSISDKEQELAKSLVEAMVGDGNFSKYHDEYREAVEELIEAKAEGKQLTATPKATSTDSSKLVDQLMESIKLAGEAKQ